MSADSQRKQSLVAIFFTFFIDYLGATIVFPIFAPLFLEQGQGLFPADISHTARISLLGLFLAIFPLTQFIFSPLLGDYADRHGRKKALVITTIVTMLGYATVGVAIQFRMIWLLFLSRLVMGASSGNLSVCLTAISDVSSTKKKKVRYYAIGSVIAGLTFVLGPLIGGKLSDTTASPHFFPAFPLYIGAGLTFLNVVYLLLAFKETLREASYRRFDLIKSVHNLQMAFRDPTLRRLYLIFFFYLLSWNMLFQFVPAYLVGAFSVSNSVIGDISAILGGCWIVGSLFFKVIYHRVPSKAILLLAAMAFALFSVLSMGPKGLLFFSVFMGIAVFFSSFPWPLCAAQISHCAPSALQGQIMGFSQSVQSLAMMIAPLIAGPLMSVHYSLAFCLAAFFSLLYPFLLFGVKFED